jgi:hypothetical protein
VGRKAGLSDDKLRAVLSEDRTSFNDTERLVIELADAMTDTPANVSDELYARLRKQFTEEQLMNWARRSRSRIIAHDGTEFSTSRAIICRRHGQTNRKNPDQPECADVSPALRYISPGQFCNPAILPPAPVI